MKPRLAILLSACVAAGAHAAPMTLQQAVERATKDAPSIRAQSAQAQAARSAATAADQLPDPTLELGLNDFPVTGPDAFTLNRDDFTMRTIGVSQDIPNIAKRRARAGRAVADIRAAEAGVRAQVRDVRVAAALAWVDLHFANRRLAILDLLDESIDDLKSTVDARLASGSARQSQALEPDQLRAQVGDRRSVIVAEQEKARAALARWTGDPEPLTIGPAPDTHINGARLLANLDSLPSLGALDARTGQAEADVRLARAEKRPDWGVSVSYGQREPRFGDLVSVGVKIDLPLFSRKRQDPLIAARASEVERARLDREAAEREAVAALRSDLAEHKMHHERLARARETLVPLAAKRAELDRTGYAAGTVDLGTALMTTIALAETELDLLDREAALVREAIRINLTYGGDSQ